MGVPSPTLYGYGVALGRQLLRAKAPGDAVRATARTLCEWFGRPVAGWVALPGSDSLSLIAAHGLPPRRRAELRRTMRTLPSWSPASPRVQQQAKRRFTEIADAAGVRVIDADSAVLMMGSTSDQQDRNMAPVASLLRQSLRKLDAAAAHEKERDSLLQLGLAWTAHELRDPLLVARMVLDRLAQGRDDRQTAARLLSETREELDDLATLVDTLLPWAVGLGTFTTERVDLGRIVQEAVHNCTVEAGTGRVRIDIAEGRVTVSANSQHLLSAISNLVRNALAYSPKDSEVVVEAARRYGAARISVRDHGPGVPPSEQQTIFDPFARGRAGQTRRGAGLGLFIARRTVEAHGGMIWVESGKAGSTFHIEIPAVNGSHLAAS